MQTNENLTRPNPTPAATTGTGPGASAPQTTGAFEPATNADFKVIRRNGAVVGFEPSKIAIAVTKAFLAVNGGQGAASARVRELVEQLTQNVVRALMRSRPNGGTFHIEDIQDQVELALMREGEHNVARAYVLYREKRAQERAHAVEAAPEAAAPDMPVLHVTDNGVSRPLDMAALRGVVQAACENLGNEVDAEPILTETIKNLYDGVPLSQVYDSAILASRTLIEKEPAYSQVTARILMHTIRREILGEEVLQGDMAARYIDYFPRFIKQGVEAELLDEQLLSYDLAKLAAALDANRDLQFNYLGLQTLYDRYFLHIDGHRIEMPQAFYMRVAMGLALNEVEREARAIEFYQILSSFDFMSSTPTLFNSGTRRSQLSSCYLTTVSDDLEGIYEALKENALLSKFAGGLGNDWTQVRALGSHIKGTNGKSQGVVPFLKVVNDTAVAVNQGGKRKGAVCAYLETWHLDIEEFLELRKNTGDDRRRTHDMNTANWIPDLFMKRVMEGAEWTLFSPSTCPDLHDKYGKAFEQAYTAYEEKAARGEIKLFKKIPAQALWRKMLGMLFETGHPWITFKDPCNIRSPQQHVGVVHSSNLCTEITLNTSETEIAVCNLGSVNLVAHLKQTANGYELDHEKLQRTIRVAMRMLDNVIDINYYAVTKARNSNLHHRPVGMGIMGFQDCLHLLRTPYASNAAVEFADRSMEAVCYYAYWASTELAKERGQYSSYKGSLWDRGILPQDSLKLLAEERGGYVDVDLSSSLDWDSLRKHIAAHGMRNSNCVAIAPTATISNIIGVSACIEPTFQNLYVKSNLSGEFTVVNEYLVRDLKARGLWDEVMVADLKYFDGSLSRIDRVPADLREIYATAFEVEPKWLVEAASRRQKWIDQAQSLNIYMAGASGKKLDETYKLAWTRGLKTTYYLRTMAATHVEKSTVSHGALNAVPSSGGMSGGFSAEPSAPLSPLAQPMPDAEGAVCTMRPGDPGFDECEACQ
ncbi:ribonucleotide-diphosphate reductase subunit alpha [Pandoraea pnomenusa]|jgi:ribonucleoside-diphosphate reductase alpha chain|uniref:Vitamin B12-dependent ribonucleotide reductase n=2 Tax=Pandoraea TaxID=93217 RepID=A0A378YMB2_9BURK|nr:MULTISPECIES: ribonucleoside-diphosphate reductase subunit alpha [Pandoraea]AHB04327.1 ribonucleotide-diphosphate reductase subunit alpha [Pandoraea pnomenusa 3kgm]AHB75283.1 ribonucleotide-diphosphate reductase subunit alpha [Pandoraea pnomenusa]AHN76344.1 ribonucleotide-diphosphate reductase subunit alpha [Pandoraea pnomenusa]AIU27029.1 ribonucleotide-diphosphate reductase subunit alpha [Pandoraea pnomenusa]ANC44239.1 ribonucleotide-diphosphate reductase subunit alpha [Pandoraea pnomenusa